MLKLKLKLMVQLQVRAASLMGMGMVPEKRHGVWWEPLRNAEKDAKYARFCDMKKNVRATGEGRVRVWERRSITHLYLECGAAGRRSNGTENQNPLMPKETSGISQGESITRFVMKRAFYPQKAMPFAFSLQS